MLHVQVQLHKERDPLAVGWDKAMGKHIYVTETCLHVWMGHESESFRLTGNTSDTFNNAEDSNEGRDLK